MHGPYMGRTILEQRLGRRPKIYFTHVDVALFGGYLPHTEFADELAQRADGSSANPKRYDSIAVSCHKFFGFPSPAGIFVCTRANFEEFLGRFSQIHNPEYLFSVPGTITCSRDAVKPAEFMFHSTKEAFARQRADAIQILHETTYLFEQLKTHFPERNPVRANLLSNTIYFEQPSDAVVWTYSLATMALARDGERIPHAHVVVMPHATRDVLDRFLSDLAA